MFKSELAPQQPDKSEINPQLEAGRRALTADLEAAGEEGLRIIYYASDVVIKAVLGDPESVTFRTQTGNSRISGKRKFGHETVSLNSMVLNSKYKDTSVQDDIEEEKAA